VMGIDFRCEHCGRGISTDSTSAGRMRCPYCNAKVEVPAVIAALPTPQIPPGDQVAAGTVSAGAENGDSSRDAQVAVGTLSRVMPWVMSGLLHVGVLLVLAFIAIVVLIPPIEDLPTAFAGMPDDTYRPHFKPSKPLDPSDRRALRDRPSRWDQRNDKLIVDNPGTTKERIDVFAPSGGVPGDGDAERFGMRETGGRFFEVDADEKGQRRGGPVDIVYVLDRSGSMINTFDPVRDELLKSILRLHPKQRFHVIFFASGKLQESPPRRLVPATSYHKREAVKYLRTVVAHDQTDVVPAIKRAFAVLGASGQARRGKVIYLLTDGEFRDNDRVVRMIRRMNAAAKGRICTILHHHRSPDAVRVLRRIAEENKGEFRFVGVGR